MQSYQLGEQICQVSPQCKQMHKRICLHCGLWPETCPLTGKSPAFCKRYLLDKIQALASRLTDKNCKKMVPPVRDHFLGHSLRRWQMPDAFASGAGCLVHYLYRSANLNFSI